MKSKYSDSTLQHMTKAELIEYICCLEHNLQNEEEMSQRLYERWAFENRLRMADVLLREAKKHQVDFTEVNKHE